MTRDVEDAYALSPVQQGMLFHVLLAPAAAVYFRQYTFPVRGELDLGAFGRAWQLVIDRHQVLRTSIHWHDLEQPVQVVHRRVRVPLTNQDWRHLGESERDHRLDTFLRDDRTAGFDLSRAPLMRLAVLRLRDDMSLVVWSNHHLVVDGWSATMIVEEVTSAYVAELEGRIATLPERIPFRDFVAWLEDRDPAEGAAYWRATLEGFGAASPLGVDHVALDVPAGDAFAAWGCPVPASTTRALDALGKRLRVTQSTIVQAAWAVLLSRYGAGDDVVFGVTLSGRSAAIRGIGSTVGMLINTLPLRLGVPDETPVEGWLGTVQQASSALLAHEHDSLVDIQRYSAVPAGSPLFQTIIVFENLPAARAQLASAGPATPAATNYSLALCVMPGQELGLRFDYDRRVFEPSTIERMAGHFVTLLEGVASAPEQPVGTLDLLSPAERETVLERFNATDAPVPERCLHELITEQALRTPDALAVVGPGPSLSYRELERRANALAHRLAAAGVGPDVLVAVCLERSTRLLVALLGVLKAGGAYLPIDPGYPAARQRFMLDDSRAQLLLTTTASGHQLAAAGVPTLELDELPDDLGADDPPSVAVQPHHLAYAIYTSGSTGTPKAALNTHRAIVNRLWWMQAAYRLTSDDRVLQKTPLSFDVSVWELFWPLLAGARLVVAKPGAHTDPLQIVEEIASAGITTIHFVPSMLEPFVEMAEPALVRSLRRVMCSGEALPLPVQRRFFARFDADLYNLYGPTEAAVDVTHHTCDRTQSVGTVPIGRPIANTRIYILDAGDRPTPIGVPGELCIGGVAVGRGYLGRPELTALRFVPDPFRAAPEARLYRTGDLARWREDGVLEYLGRLDDQVKIRGFRIELGEVEAALMRHPGVREAAVAMRHESPTGPQLVAYYVPREAPLATSELRATLRESLPEPMIPAAFVVLETLPLTASGKADRRALPPFEFEPVAELATVRPRNPIEERIAALWTEVLGTAPSSVHDDFFALGGHSLLVTRLASRLQATYGVSIPLGHLFEAPTVAEQAVTVENLLIDELERTSRDERLEPAAPTRGVGATG